MDAKGLAQSILDRKPSEDDEGEVTPAEDDKGTDKELFARSVMSAFKSGDADELAEALSDFVKACA